MFGGRVKHDDRALVWEIVSAMLRYPSEELIAALPQIAAAARDSPIGDGEAIAELAERWQQADLTQLQADYVEVFDLGRSRSLYLSWHQYGDRRQRGMVLLKLKRRYREYGYGPVTDELPDWLPMALEFASVAPEPVGRDLLESWRAPIELIRRNLHARSDEHAVLLDAVSATLSKLGSDIQAAVTRLLEEGPPDEEVGLSPFGPDEEMLEGLPPSEMAGAETPLMAAGERRP
jgi:nitrate reductase delta subunit